MRDIGFTRREAELITRAGLAAIEGDRPPGDELDPLRQALQRLAQAINS